MHLCGHEHVVITKKGEGAEFARLANVAAEDMQAALYALLIKLPTSKWTAELTRAIANGDSGAIQAALLANPFPPGDYRDLAAAIARAVAAGVQLELPELPPIADSLAAQVTVSLPPEARAGMILGDPAALRFLNGYAMGMINTFENSIRDGVRVVINEGIVRGAGPRRTAVAVRKLVGLTEHQAKAVISFRDQLVAWPPKSAKGWGLGQQIGRSAGGEQVYPLDADGKLADPIKERRLRDFRYDKVLQQALDQRRPLTKAQIDQMVEAYARKFVKLRSQTVARSESIRALNAGQRQTWQASIDKGLVDRSLVYKRWLVAPDERTCKLCQGLASHYNKMNNGWGIPFDQPFDPTPMLGRKGVTPSAIKGAKFAPDFSTATAGSPTIVRVEVQHPPIHPSCFPGDAIVTSGYGIAAVSRRPYEGDMIIVSVAGKVSLTVTPNHPILTTRGWVHAGELHEGDYLVDQSIADRFAGESADLYQDRMPAKFAEIFDLANVAGISPLVSEQPVSTADFHGDGWEGQVRIVATDGSLARGVPAALSQGSMERILQMRRAAEIAIEGGRDFLAMLVGLLRAANGIVSGGGQSPALTGLCPRHAREHALAAVAGIDPAFQQDAANYLARNAERGGHRLLAFAREVAGDRFVGDWFAALGGTFGATPSWPHDAGSADNAMGGRGGHAGSFGDLGESIAGKVALDDQLARAVVGGHGVGFHRVSGISRVRFRGEVYNAETAAGFYAVNGFVVHNCRCRILYRLVTPGMVS